MRSDSIRAKGLPAHVNEYCEKYGIPYNYEDLDRWLKNGDEFGEPVNMEWLRRRFKKQSGVLISRPTIEKWLTIFKENNVQTR